MVISSLGHLDFWLGFFGNIVKFSHSNTSHCNFTQNISSLVHKKATYIGTVCVVDCKHLYAQKMIRPFNTVDVGLTAVGGINLMI